MSRRGGMRRHPWEGCPSSLSAGGLHRGRAPVGGRHLHVCGRTRTARQAQPGPEPGARHPWLGQGRTLIVGW
eukprot:3772021-Pyramimonas_sp.AAC.1